MNLKAGMTSQETRHPFEARAGGPVSGCLRFGAQFPWWSSLLFRSFGTPIADIGVVQPFELTFLCRQFPKV